MINMIIKGDDITRFHKKIQSIFRESPLLENFLYIKKAVNDQNYDNRVRIRQYFRVIIFFKHGKLPKNIPEKGKGDLP